MTELTESRFIHIWKNPKVVYVLECSQIEKSKILKALRLLDLVKKKEKDENTYWKTKSDLLDLLEQSEKT